MRKIGLTRYGSHNVTKKVLAQVRKYELDASRYGLSLLHEVGIENMDQWLSDWQNGDWVYLKYLYTTGKKQNITKVFLNIYKKRYIKKSSSILKPLPVPKFVPNSWENRYLF